MAKTVKATGRRGFFILVGAAASFDRNARQSGGPAEHVGALLRLPDELRDPLNKQINTK